MSKLFGKKIILLVLSLFLLNNLAWAAPKIEDAPDPDPNKVYPLITADNLNEMTAAGAVLMDQVSGRVLYAKNPDEYHYPASTTKILTALLAVESGKLDEVVEIPEEAVGLDGSGIYVSKGDKLKLRDIVQATMLASGNDGAMAIALYLGNGSLAKFVAMMNEKAKALGANHSHFHNPHGLPDDEHYSTALDMGIIARYAYFNPEFRKIVGSTDATIKWVNSDRQEQYFSTNRLLWNYDDVKGIKTGYTEKASGCFVGAAEQKGTTLITVVLRTIDGGSIFPESRALMDYGFRSIVKRISIPTDKLSTKIYVHNSGVAKVEAVPMEEFSYPLLKGEKEGDFSYKVEMDKYLPGPAPKGTVVGQILLYKQGQLVGSMPMVTAEDAPEGFSFIGFFHKLFFS